MFTAVTLFSHVMYEIAESRVLPACASLFVLCTRRMAAEEAPCSGREQQRSQLWTGQWVGTHMQQQQAVMAHAQLTHASNPFNPCSNAWMSTQHGRGAALLLAVLTVFAQPFTGSSQAPKPKDVIPIHLGPVQVGQKERCRGSLGGNDDGGGGLKIM